MEIELKQDIEPAQAGTYQLGDAGEVEFQFDGSALTLVDVRTQEGWNAVVDEEASDEIEVDFMFGNVEWEFEAEVDDGELEVEIDQKISGPIPNQ